MAGITVEQLYELCEVLDQSENKEGENQQEEFLKILSGTKSGTNEKRLTSQLIIRYFARFPDLQDKALDALFELCEDDDVTIRKMVIKELPAVCKETGPHVSKVADVLTQLLQSDDTHEQTVVHHSLLIILNKFPKETLVTIFGHITNADEDLIRERAIKFLALKLKTLPANILTPENQTYIYEESKKVMQDVTGEEFILFMHVLGSLAQLQTVTGRKQLLDLVIDQADLEKAFQTTDADRVDQVFQCVKQSVQFVSKNVPSTRLTEFMLDKVVPGVGDLESSVRLELLRLVAELAPSTGDLANISTLLNPLFQKLMEYLPIPPSEAEGAENEQNAEEPTIQFSEVECLMWALHQLAKRHPTFFTEENPEVDFKEFRKRIQYLARVIQVYSKKLRQLLLGKSKEELTKDENKIKVLALRTTSNINILIRDLLHTEPTYKSSIIPSWKPPEQKPAAAAVATVRKSQSSEEATATKTAKREITRYHPPGGKFSEKVGTYMDQEEQKIRGRGGFRGGRGRGFRNFRYRY